MDSILVIAKPSGPTSFAIVARVKSLTREKRVGHGGTLDPLASGVLPLFLGRATRLVEYLQEYPKTYRAGIELGITTNSYDAQGQVTGRMDIFSHFSALSSQLTQEPALSIQPINSLSSVISPLMGEPRRSGSEFTQEPTLSVQPINSLSSVISPLMGETRRSGSEGGVSSSLNSKLKTQNPELLSAIEAALPSFLGNIMQTPPIFSALKRDGEPLYKLARQGLAPEMAARPVTIHRLEIVDFQPPLLTLDVECSKGTYIRSLAHDLGQKLGVGAHLKSLERTAYGPFAIKNAVSLEQVEEAVREGSLPSLLQPMDAVLASWPSVVLTAEQEADVRNGKQVALPAVISSQSGSDPSSPPPRLRAYGQEGRLAALLSLDAGTNSWRPDKVLI